MHVVTPMDKSKLNTYVHGRTDAYDKYWEVQTCTLHSYRRISEGMEGGKLC